MGDMKRLIGKDWGDQNVENNMKYWTFKVTDNENLPVVNVQHGDQPSIFPEKVSTEVLKKMKETVARVASKEITKVVITVPAYFNQLQRQATKDAAHVAGLEVLELITEPAAAAYAYGFGRQKFTDDNLLVKPSYHLILDLGGGTFDVVIVKVNAGQFKVVSIGRDTHLGGRDFDNLLMDYCTKEIHEKYKEECFNNLQKRQKLLAEVIKAKENLSTADSTEIFLGSIVNDIDAKLVITRETFDKISSELYKKIKDLTKQVLSDVFMVPNDIHEVLLIGGSSRIPAVRALLVKMFPVKFLNDTSHVDEAVAYGAALRAAQLSTPTNKEVPNITLIEATQLSLSVNVSGNRAHVIIKRNQRVPVSNTITLYTTKEHPTINVYEGERPIINLNHHNLLGSLEIDRIVGSQKFDITLELERSGILTVKAQYQDKDKNIKIEPKKIDYNQKKADDQRIEQMLHEEKMFREEDTVEYELQTSKTDLQFSIEQLEYKLKHKKKSLFSRSKKSKQICEDTKKWLNENPMATCEMFNQHYEKIDTLLKKLKFKIK
uniref:Heat shock protein 70 n=1 Tax=Acrobeloides nanus TaxID=290746 RepID=A0A914DY08_9BILA